MAHQITSNAQCYTTNSDKGSFFNYLRTTAQIAKQHRQLAKLTPSQLDDIGITQKEAEDEINSGKFF